MGGNYLHGEKRFILYIIIIFGILSVAAALQYAHNKAEEIKREDLLGELDKHYFAWIERVPKYQKIAYNTSMHGYVVTAESRVIAIRPNWLIEEEGTMKIQNHTRFYLSGTNGSLSLLSVFIQLQMHDRYRVLQEVISLNSTVKCYVVSGMANVSYQAIFCFTDQNDLIHSEFTLFGERVSINISYFS